MSQAIGLANRHKKRVALLFVDMDDFKQINDTIGHLNGDSALKLMAERLLSCVRTTDTICRRNGDEFIVLLTEVERIEDVIQIAKHMLSATAKPAEINGHQVTLSSSIGISIFPEDGDNLTSLMQSADNAMYEAKKLGHSHYHFVKHAKSRQRKKHPLCCHIALIFISSPWVTYLFWRMHMRPIKSLSVVMISAILLFSGVGVMMSGCASTSTQSGTGEYIDDSVITTKVKAAILKEEDLKVTEINVETFKGVVQLSGFVSSQADINQAVMMARGVAGVKSVKNDMRIK